MNAIATAPKTATRRSASLSKTDMPRAYIATKPRAKSVKKAAPEVPSPSAVIDQICKLVAQVDNLLTAAGQVGTPDDVGDRLIRITEEDLITRFFETLQPEAFSEATVHRATDVLYDLEAGLRGVEAMHRGEGRGLLMEQALVCVDKVSALMAPVGFWPVEVQVSTLYLDEEHKSFTRGRDMAIALLREARELVDTDESSARRWQRNGKPQENFVYDYLTDIIRAPSTQRGFSVVLSAAIGGDLIYKPELFAGIPMAEYQAGEIGADGTQTEEPPAKPAVVLPPSTSAPSESQRAQDPSKSPAKIDLALDGFDDAYCLVLQALHIAKIAAREGEGMSDVGWGIHTLIDRTAEQILVATEKSSEDELEEASKLLAQCLGVINKVNDGAVDCNYLYAAATLLMLTKKTIDNAIGSLQ